jgi:hypothetical protein
MKKSSLLDTLHEFDCARCGHTFQLGDTIVILQLWVKQQRRNLCDTCADAVISEIDRHTKAPTYEATA